MVQIKNNAPNTLIVYKTHLADMDETFTLKVCNTLKKTCKEVAFTYSEHLNFYKINFSTDFGKNTGKGVLAIHNAASEKVHSEDVEVTN